MVESPDRRRPPGFASPGLIPSGSAAIDPSGDLTRELRSFKGAAATIRFNSNGLELAAVSEANLPGSAGFVGDQAGAGVTRLPDDTAAAFGISLQKGWLRRFSAGCPVPWVPGCRPAR